MIPFARKDHGYCMRCGSGVEDMPQGCKTRCPVCDFPYPQGSCSD